MFENKFANFVSLASGGTALGVSAMLTAGGAPGVETAVVAFSAGAAVTGVLHAFRFTMHEIADKQAIKRSYQRKLDTNFARPIS